MDSNGENFSYCDGISGVRSIAIDNTGLAWAGMTSGYITSFNPKDNSTVSYKKDTHGIDGRIWAVAVDKNNVKWFGSGSGVTCFNGITWKTFAPEGWYHTEDDGSILPRGDQVYSLAFDDDGFLWAGTSKGLYRFETVSTAVRNDYLLPTSDCLASAPNPFNASTTLSFTLPTAGYATLSVYSVTGQRIRTLVSGPMVAGTHTATWDGRDENGRPVSSGVYVSRLESNGRFACGKMLLMK
jgi:hypothetical protein